MNTVPEVINYLETRLSYLETCLGSPSATRYTEGRRDATRLCLSCLAALPPLATALPCSARVPDAAGWWWLETHLETLPVRVEEAREFTTRKLVFRLHTVELSVGHIPPRLWHGPCSRSQP